MCGSKCLDEGARKEGKAHCPVMNKEKAVRSGDLVSIVMATDDSATQQEHSHASIGFRFGRRGFH
jgi:hypothetical protein